VLPSTQVGRPCAAGASEWLYAAGGPAATYTEAIKTSWSNQVEFFKFDLFEKNVFSYLNLENYSKK
jgi:hypothetical protein